MEPAAPETILPPMPLATRREMIAGLALASAGSAARAAPPAGLKLTPTFSEDFSEPVSFFDPHTGKGRWKTNYWFGNQQDASSRALPDEKQIYVDQAYCGVTPFVQKRPGLAIVADKNRNPADRRLFKPYAGGGTPEPYTSGLITTEASFRQQYGYFEATMTFPQVRGCWPAFWLLGPPGTEHAGDEIDVIEWVASNPRRLFFNAHLAGNGHGSWVDGFDTAKPTAYGLLWTAERLAWFIDGRPVHQQENPGLHAPMYMLINLAVGGWDNNLPEDPSGFPATLLITSVEAFQVRR
jgi:beta-glucanase (GH16 family)